MNTHDIELPPLPDWADRTLQGEDRDSLFAWAIAAIEADRKHFAELFMDLSRYAAGMYEQDHDPQMEGVSDEYWHAAEFLLGNKDAVKELEADRKRRGGPVAIVRHYEYSGSARNGLWQEAVMLDGAPVLPDGAMLYTAPQPQEQARGEPVAKIDPNPPQLSIVWHDSPESVDRAMWEQSAIESGITYEELIEGSSVGETEDGEVFEFTHEQAIDGMRTQGCWGFVDTKTNTINAWAADDVDASTVLHMLAHEIGHVTGDPHDDDIQEEMRAEQFGRVAALAYRLWCEKKSDAPQPLQIPEPAPLRESMSSNHRSYAEGWNACRAAMLEAAPTKEKP